MTNITQIEKLKEQLEINTLGVNKIDTGKNKENLGSQNHESSKNDFAALKAEIEFNAGLILKFFPETPSTVPEESNSSSILSDLSSLLKNSKLPKIINKLKSENISLTKRFQAQHSEHNAILKEKSLLIREIKRLRNEPEKIEALNHKIEELEKRSRINGENHVNLLEDKKQLVIDYEKTLQEVSHAKRETAKSAKTIDELKFQFQFLKIEKENLKFDLREIKRDFKKRLTANIKKIEAEYEDKVTNIRKKKERISKFSEHVMEDSDTPAWMVTYADMVTLLLTFFILYYSIASQNVMKFKEVIMGEEKNNIGLIELIDTMTIRTSLNEWTGFQKNTLVNAIEKVATDKVTMEKGQNRSRVVVRIPGRTLFKPGSADLDKAGWPSLTEIATIFKKYPNYKINIQGHTDDLPVASDRFPTNWELSAVRATAVLRFFSDKGIDPLRMTATGYADTFPLGPNTTAEERAKNRRVEFVLEKIK